MNISYDYYRVFYYVAKYRSFTYAANALFTNQPNVTRCIRLLEHALGCRLFLRSNRGVKLTPEGEQLFSHVSAAVSQLETAESELRSSVDLQNGTLSIGASETALHGLLLNKLRTFHRQYPGIRLRISNHSTPQAIDALLKGIVDFSVVTSPTGISRPLKEIPLKHFREIPVCSAEYRDLCETTHTLESLLPCISLISLEPGTGTHSFYVRYFSSRGLTFSPDMEAATTDQILLMIRHGLGFGFLPEDFVCDALKQQEVFRIPIDDPLPERSISLILDPERPLGPAARTMLYFLQETPEPPSEIDN